MSEGRPPKTFQWMEAVNQTLADIKDRLEVVVRPGATWMSSFRPSELLFGVYHANGDRYGVDTDQGKVLVAMSGNWKSDWKITISGGTINLPNFYSSDGKGRFVRSGTTPGVAQGDATRNITGEITMGSMMQEQVASVRKGVFTGKTIWMEKNAWVMQSNSDLNLVYFPKIDASLQVPTADENRPLNVTMTPVVYLGV